MKLNYNFHTHTFRCGHASGTDNQYVESAINNGFKAIGFSDHIFLDGINQPRVRGNISCLDDYISSISYLKDKYINKINIYTGFEAEFSNRFKPFLESLLIDKKVDFLICGQHFDFDNEMCRYISAYKNDRSVTLKYFEQLTEAIKSGLFLYIAHPDLYVTQYYEFDDFCAEIAHKICKIAEEHHIPLELNAHAMMCWEKKGEGLVYPENKFWEIASKYNVEVVIGLDAHDPEEFSEDIGFIYNIINNYNLKLADFDKVLANYLHKIATYND